MILDVDSISATLPAGVVTSSVDGSIVSECPDSRGGRHVAVSRTMTVGPEFESTTWATRVTKRYEGKGWNVTLRTLGSRDHTELKLVGQRLLIYRVALTNQDGVPHVTIRSTSRCLEPASD